MSALYDSIGIDYARLRKPDARIAALIDHALGDAETVLNVGAGAGSYEPKSRKVTAVEPSAEMIRQRPDDAAPVIQASAEALPFADGHFDAAMAILTVHHWKDKRAGLSELCRVSRGPVVILTFEPSFRGFWLTDYVPGLIALDEQQMPPLALYAEMLGEVEIQPVLIPHDCTDGFLAAYWRRPEAYLDPHLRAAMSSFRILGDVTPQLEKLRGDLDSGAWNQAQAHILDLPAFDCGYRLVIRR